MIYIGLTVLLYQAEESNLNFEESEGNVRASFCSNGSVDSGSESENMFRAASNHVVFDRNQESDLESEFTRSVNFEKALFEISHSSVSCSLPDELFIGLQFDSWEAAELYIREYGKKRGFPESNGVYVSFMNLEHNHNLNADNVKFAATFRKFDQDIMSEIEHAVIYRYLSNAIQKIKRKYKITGSDASKLLKYLLEKQKNEPMMFIQHLINTDNDRLCGIFWITEDQIAVSASSTMADVVEALEPQMQKEALNKSFMVWKYKSTTFELVLYRCEKVPNEEAFELTEDQLVISKESIQEVWRIVPYMATSSTSSYQHIILLLVSHGTIYNIWNKVELASNELLIGASSKRLKSSYDNILQRTYPIPKYYVNVQEDYVHLPMCKKLYYEKEKSRQINMQSEHEILRENTNSNYEIKLSNGRMLDVNTVKVPLEHIENKYKVDNSDTNNTVGSRKCGLCHKTGHYAPKHPTKNSD
ncbi:20618_t:CDS:10, partial [Gigaspora rosea]